MVPLILSISRSSYQSNSSNHSHFFTITFMADSESSCWLGLLLGIGMALQTNSYEFPFGLLLGCSFAHVLTKSPSFCMLSLLLVISPHPSSLNELLDSLFFGTPRSFRKQHPRYHIPRLKLIRLLAEHGVDIENTRDLGGSWEFEASGMFTDIVTTIAQAVITPSSTLSGQPPLVLIESYGQLVKINIT